MIICHNKDVFPLTYNRNYSSRQVEDKKREIKCNIEEKCNKIILLKDIHNIATKSRNVDENETSLQGSIEKLKNKYGKLP